jgi:hypothetical protein
VAVNRELRTALLKKLDVTPQRLSQRAGERKRQLPMSTEEAVYTIAHDEGIDISKHLTPDEVAAVRTLVAQLPRPAANGPAPTVGKKAKAATAKEVRVTIAGVDVGTIPGLAPLHAKEAKRMAERVYPTMYLFENSVRDVIERVLKHHFGNDWWTKAVPGKVQQRAADHKAQEAIDPWHGTRGDRELDYVLLTDLWAIVKHQWTHFKDLFPSQAWFENLITHEMNVSRRVIAHMNPLAADDVTGIETAFRKWVKQLKAVKDQLP